jgi:hypothetical protein
VTAVLFDDRMKTPSYSSPQAPAQSLARQYHADGSLNLRGDFNRAEMTEMDAEAARVFQRQDLIDQDNIRCRWQNAAATLPPENGAER